MNMEWRVEREKRVQKKRGKIAECEKITQIFGEASTPAVTDSKQQHKAQWWRGLVTSNIL